MIIPLSIIVPVYNVENYLWKQIDSLRSQTFTNWECILVDDCSTDASGQICDLAEKADERFRVIHNARNMGLSATRNIGMKSSQGEFILFCDPDDWMDPNMLKETIGRYYGVDMIVCGVNVVRKDNDQESVSPNVIWDIKEPVFISDRRSIYEEILCKTGTMWNKVIRKEVIHDVIFDENMTYGEDTVFLAKMLSNVRKAVLIPSALYYYYSNRPGNVVSTRNRTRDLEFIKNSYEVYQACSENELPLCGIFRMMVAVEIVLRKSKEKSDTTKDELKTISEVLRRVSLPDQINYIFTYKRGKQNIKYLLAAYFPVAYFKRVIRGTVVN